MKEKIIIVGAGLCGTLLALRLAQRDYPVILIEKRPDMRLSEQVGGRSINLALSPRGLDALDLAGVKDEVLKLCTPMNGRLIHEQNGETYFLKYSGRAGEHINSVSRSGLNIVLLNNADSYKNLSVRFDTECTGVDLERGVVFLRDIRGKNTEIKGDLIFGTDGAGSAVRRSMFERSSDLLFNYSQNYLRSGYKELNIPPGDDGSFRIRQDALHIWPRDEFMMIALPNRDASFTVTLFHPFEGPNGFNKFETPDLLLDFFGNNYADVMDHMPSLVDDYFRNPVGILGTIKTYPWHAYGKVLLLGDAAHAIVPFYGQGMNASFEDVSVLDKTLDECGGDWEKTLMLTQEKRVENTNAIADLALDNFIEMRDKVNDVEFVKKRNIEMMLEQKYKDYYSKYSLVTFRPDMPYKEAMVRGRAQDDFLLKLCKSGDIDQLDLDQVFHQLQNVAI